MDIHKAQRLLLKIQALLDGDNGNTLTRLEKDLMKSYIQQLYDAVTTDEEVTTSHPPQPRIEFISPTPKAEPKPEPKFEYIPPPPPEPQPEPKIEYISPPPPEPQPEPKIEFTPPPPVSEPPPSVTPKPQPEYTPPPPPVIKVEPKIEYTPPPVPEAVVLNVIGDDEAMNKLFDTPKADEISGKFNHVPIPSIESAMGLNERIFTLNELFGGDKGLFDATCAQLNQLSSYDEARSVLIAGAASRFKWTLPDRIKMAEQFLRIVAKRYPRT